MLFTRPIPFGEAIQALVARGIMPTDMSSAELARLKATVRQRAFFSARMTKASYLEEAKAVVLRILNPRTVTREDGTPKTEGLSKAKAQELLMREARRMGYQPPEGKEGTLQDHGSLARTRLVVEMNTSMAAGYGFWRINNSEAALFSRPARELYRLVWPKGLKRDWFERWVVAARVAKDATATNPHETGVMIARADSEIWVWLSRFKTPWPPFDYNSGMRLRLVPRKEAVELGVIKAVDVVKPSNREFDLGEVSRGAEGGANA